MKVLYVEDQEISRKLVAKFLRREQFTVYESSNGAEGLSKYYEVNPELVLTNLEMPEMSGFDMIRAIRSFDKAVPILVITGYREEAMSISHLVNGFVFKPILCKELITSINQSVLC